MKKVLVTGGAGYVGTSLIPQLLGAGYRVRVLDNLMFGGDQLLPFIRSPNFKFIKGDVRDAAAVFDAVRGCDVVVHLAAIVGFPACRAFPQLARETNVNGSMNVAAAVSRDQLILYGSTGSNYGAVSGGLCTEETPLQPLSLYGETKTQAEAHLLEHASTVAFRFATAFGLSPRLRLDLLVNDFTYRAATQQNLIVYEKNFMRTFIHVHDMGRAFILAIDRADAMRGQVYNIGDDTLNYSKREVCEMIQGQIKCYVHYAEIGEDPDKRNYIVSYRKIDAMGYRTTITLEAGIAELIKGFQVLTVKNPYTNI